MNSDKFFNILRIIEFITNNGWHFSTTNDNFSSYCKNNSIGIDISNNEVVLIGDCGDFAHIEINQYAIYTLLGYFINNHILAMDYEWI